MQITIIALGSRGDIYPYTALGKGLSKEGHDVRIASHHPYEPIVLAHGLAFEPITGDPRALLMTEDAVRWLESGRNPLLFIRQFIRLSNGFFERSLDDCWRACQGSDAIIYSTLGWAGYHIAESMGIPAFSAPLQPVSRTRAFPTMFVPSSLKLGPTLNSLSHQISEQMLWQPFRRQVNKWRRGQLKLHASPFFGPFAELERGAITTIYGYSSLVVPRPADWSSFIHVTGYWFLDPVKPWQPDKNLEAFLESGRRPISIGFGSMTNRKPAALMDIVLKALDLAGERAVLLSGWSGHELPEVPKHIYPADYIPHNWLFPRMKAVMHHGGAGTTAAGLRAGVPSILVPFFGDQPFWGQRVEALGVGPQPLMRNRLTPERLATAIRQTVENRDMRERARKLGEQIRAEDGVKQAVGVIEDVVIKQGR